MLCYHEGLSKSSLVEWQITTSPYQLNRKITSRYCYFSFFSLPGAIKLFLNLLVNCMGITLNVCQCENSQVYLYASVNVMWVCSQRWCFFLKEALEKKYSVITPYFSQCAGSKFCWGRGQPGALLLQEEITSWSTRGNNEDNTARALKKMLCVAEVKAEITRLLILLFSKTLRLDLWITSASCYLLSHIIINTDFSSVVQCNYHSKLS